MAVRVSSVVLRGKEVSVGPLILDGHKRKVVVVKIEFGDIVGETSWAAGRTTQFPSTITLPAVSPARGNRVATWLRDVTMEVSPV